MGRNFSLWNLLHNYHGQVDLAFARMMWRFGGPPMPYGSMEEAVADYRVSQAKHWAGQICSPGNAMGGILQPDGGDEGVLHVSHGCAARGIGSPSAAGGVVVRLNPTHTFFELKLAGNPNAVSAAARDRAKFDLWDANQAFSKVGMSDARYLPLERIVNQAVTEWQKGHFYGEEAQAASGSDRIVKLGQTIRCYTRCQCYARQVINEMAPPAQRPEDLGLDTWPR